MNKGVTATDLLSQLIEEKFEESTIDHPCVHARHVTELMHCPVFMDHDINYTDDPNQIVEYVKKYLRRVKKYLKKRGEQEDIAILDSLVLDGMVEYITSHPSFRLYFGLVLYKKEMVRKNRK